MNFSLSLMRKSLESIDCHQKWTAFGHAVILSRHGRLRWLAKPDERCTTFAGLIEVDDTSGVILSRGDGEGPPAEARWSRPIRGSFAVYAAQDDR